MAVIGRSPWWEKRVHADRRPLLATRGRIRDAIRRYFVQNGFVEVECGALQVSPGNEAHLHAFETQSIATDGSRRQLYLHTSPEFACKKLLAAGERRIFTFAPVYRNRERGDLHAPEFTMLEWYRAEEPYDAVIADCLHILRIAAVEAGTSLFRFRDRHAAIVERGHPSDHGEVVRAGLFHASAVVGGVRVVVERIDVDVPEAAPCCATIAVIVVSVGSNIVRSFFGLSKSGAFSSTGAPADVR